MSFSTENNNIRGLKCSLCCWKQIPNLFIAQLYEPLSELCAPLAIRFQIANSCTRWRCNYKELSQHERRVDFSKNLNASFFNDNLSNEPNFGRIHFLLDSTFKY
jgi:hypothetical protein